MVNIVERKPYSKDPEDSHLQIVLAEVGGYEPWVVWLHNQEDGGFYCGEYFACKYRALKAFDERGVG